MAIFGKRDREGAPEAGPPGAEARGEPARLDYVNPAPARRESQVTTIGPTLKVRGELVGDEDVSIEGRLDGIVNIARHLTVGKGGSVEADVRALSVVVHGRVIGNVMAEQKVEIFPSGRLEGNIKSPKISIHEGAHFKGNVDMSAGSQGAQAPAGAVAQAAPASSPAGGRAEAPGVARKPGLDRNA